MTEGEPVDKVRVLQPSEFLEFLEAKWDELDPQLEDGPLVEDLILDGLDLSDQDFQSVRFSRVSMRATNLSGTGLNRGWLNSCDLSAASLRHSDLIKCELDDCTVRNVDFVGADLTRTFFADCDLRGSTFRQTWLGSTTFASADLRSVTFDGSIFERTTFDSNMLDGISALDVRGSITRGLSGSTYRRSTNDKPPEEQLLLSVLNSFAGAEVTLYRTDAEATSSAPTEPWGEREAFLASVRGS